MWFKLVPIYPETKLYKALTGKEGSDKDPIIYIVQENKE